MRYYIATIDERCGDYNFTTTIKFAMREPEKDFFNTPEECAYQNAEKYCDDMARTWYDEDEGGEEEDENWYSFNGGEVACCYGFHKEISKETFNELGSFVSDLTSWEVSELIRKENDEAKDIQRANG